MFPSLEMRKLVLVVGAPASGKTFFARKLSEVFGLQFVNSEQIKKDSGMDTKIYAQSAGREKAYERIYDEIFRLLGLGMNVVTDAPHNSEMRDKNFIKKLKDEARKLDFSIDVKIIWVFLSEKQIHDRMKSRHNSSDEFKLMNWNMFVNEELMKFSVVHPHLKVGQNPSLRRIRQYLLE